MKIRHCLLHSNGLFGFMKCEYCRGEMAVEIDTSPYVCM